MSKTVLTFAEPKIIYWGTDENIVIDDNNIMYKAGGEIHSGFKEVNSKIRNIYPSTQGNKLYYIISDEDILYEVNDNKKIKIDNDVKIVAIAKNSVVEGIWYIKKDNSLWGMGENKYGQLGNGSFDAKSEPVKIMDNVVKVNALENMVFALTSNNELFIWGNCAELLDNDTYKPISVPTKVLDNVADYSFKLCFPRCNVFGLYLDIYGNLYSWEINDGIFGSNEKTMSFAEEPQLIMSDVKSFKVYSSSALIEKNDSTLWFWGKNYCNLANDENISIVAKPKKIGQQVTDYSYFDKFVLILKQNGELIRYSDMREPHVVSSGYEYGLYKDTALNNVKKILIEENGFRRTFNSTAYVLCNDNSVYGMGYNFYDNLGVEAVPDKFWIYEPIKIEFLTDLYNQDDLSQGVSSDIQAQKNINIHNFLLAAVFLIIIFVVIYKYTKQNGTGV